MREGIKQKTIRGLDPIIWSKFVKHVQEMHERKKMHGLHNGKGGLIAQELNRILGDYLTRKRTHTKSKRRMDFEEFADDIKGLKENDLKREAETMGAYAANYLAVIPRMIAKRYGTRTIEKYAALLYQEGVLCAFEAHAVINNGKVMLSKKGIENALIFEQRLNDKHNMMYT